MQRAVTAIYRSYDAASLVRDELERLGLSRRHITIIPDAAEGTAPATAGSAQANDIAAPARGTTGGAYVGAPPGAGVGVTPGHDEAIPAGADTRYDDAIDRLNGLHLPEDDTRIYQEAIRSGDYVVSVEVANDADIVRVQEIMRRPEDAYDLDEARRRHSNVITDDTATRTMAAIFDSEAEAGDAVRRLRAAGVPDRCLRVNPTATEQRDLQAYGDRHKRFYESIKDLSLPEEDTQTFVEAMTRGAYLVTVHAFDASMHDIILDVLEDDGTVDLDARASEWRASGWSHDADLSTRGTIYNQGMQDGNLQMAADASRRSQADLGSQQRGTTGRAGTTGTTGVTGGREYDEDGTVKVVEERLAVGKRDVEQGSVRVRSYVREEPVSADVDLRSTRVHVERRPVDRAVSPGDLSRGEQVIEAREHGEEAVVAKEARVVEEIGLRQETEVEHQHVQDTVRKTEVEIEDTRTGESSRLTGDKDRRGT